MNFALSSNPSLPVETPALNGICAAEVILRNMHNDKNWEILRRRIYQDSIHFTDQLCFDFRRLLTDTYCAEVAGQLMWRLIKPLKPQVLIGPGFGAMPLLMGVAMAALQDGTHLSVLTIKDNRLNSGQEKWITGRLKAGQTRAVVVDDFMEGGSAVALVDQAMQADDVALEIQAIVLFFDMWQPLGSRQISIGQYPVLSLYRRHDIGLSRDCHDALPPLMKGSHEEFVDQPLWWRFDLNKNKSQPRKCTPVVADNAVFVADDSSQVWRHNAVTGDIEWSYQSLHQPLKGIVQQLQYADNSIVFGCYDGAVTRLDAATGNVIWRWRQDSSIHATPELDLENNRLFISTEQWNDGKPFGHLYCLEWTTGKAIWSLNFSWWPPGSPLYDRNSNSVFATCNDRTIIAVNADTGNLRWTQPTLGLVRGKPGIAGDRVFIATETGRICALDVHTGTNIWTTRYGKGAAHQFLQTFGDVVIALDDRWHLVAFDLSTGAIRWLSRLRSAGNWCPVSYGKYFVVLSQDGHLAVFDPSREIKVWEGSVGGRYRQPPGVGHSSSGDVIAVASNNHGLKVFRIHPDYADQKS